MNYSLINDRDKTLSTIEQILVNRGINKQDIGTYLNLDDSVLISPYKLNNIELAANRLIRAILNQEKIYVQVDSDCDGYTSAAVLINYLHRIFPATVKNNISYGLHKKKEHGIAKNNIPSDCSLVIAPDSSSNENELHSELIKNGVDVIVLDHHSVDNYEYDGAIIVNNQLSDKYDNKSLSGVGVVYKFCQVLDNIIKCANADYFLDLVALGLVADMMDLRSFETKRLINKGCQNIINPFLVEICKKNSFMMKDKINPFTLSFYVAPFINAITRSGSDDEKILVFESLLEYKSYEMIPSTKRGCKGTEESLCEQAIRTTFNVKKHQDDLKMQMLEQLRPTLDNDDGLYGILIIQLENPVEQNLTGLLANQIMAEYKRPTLILNKKINEETGEITWEGSGRGFRTEQVADWRLFIQPYATFAEGHPFAFGVGFDVGKLENFKNVLKNSRLDFSKQYPVDFEFSQSDDFDKIISEIPLYDDLWGKEVDKPLVVLKNITLRKNNIQLLGKGTLKITINNHKTTIIKFGGTEIYDNLFSQFFDQDSTIKVNLLGECQLNDFNGNITPQIKLIDYDILRVDRWGF